MRALTLSTTSGDAARMSQFPLVVIVPFLFYHLLKESASAGRRLLHMGAAVGRYLLAEAVFVGLTPKSRMLLYIPKTVFGSSAAASALAACKTRKENSANAAPLERTRGIFI